MDLMHRRRELIAMQKEEELYPIGTDILEMYIGRDSSGKVLTTEGYGINSSGETYQISGRSTSETYIPVSQRYTYKKGAKRVMFHCYDKNKNYLGVLESPETWLPSEVDIRNNFVAGTVWVRVTLLTGNNRVVAVTRTE